MKKVKKKNAITLLALVLTIVIMLLLAGIVIQMTLGENGLIAKSTQAQKEQAKAELYDTAKQSYTRLSLQAVENKMPKPGVEEVLTTEEFTAKYNVVGGNITDKKGTVIDTKEAVLEMLKTKYIVPTSELEEEESTPATPAESWPKTVGDVTIQEEDKEKTIFKLKVLGDRIKLRFEHPSIAGKISIDYGNGNVEQKFYLNRKEVEYTQGEYIIKLSDMKENYRDLQIGEVGNQKKSEIEVLQWGKMSGGENYIQIKNVSKVYEPEPDKNQIRYEEAKFTEIPEWLFSKKIESRRMSQFLACENITSIPEGLFENNKNARDFSDVFILCTGITSIPEGLFKNNVNATDFRQTFSGCRGLTSIPEGLFKNNVNVTNFRKTFQDCTGLTSIPENLFKNNVNVTKFELTFYRATGLTTITSGIFKYNTNVTSFGGTFLGCKGITTIPEELFKNNTNVTEFVHTFNDCTGLTSIPENLFKYNVNVISFEGIFGYCNKLTNIPENLFKHNVNATNFSRMFQNCLGITNNIPEGLFKYNINATNFSYTFAYCRELTSIPEGLFKNNVKVTTFYETFIDCERLTNIPEGLFKENVNVIEFIHTFSGCSRITSIPEGLFKNNVKVTSFAFTFYQCYNLISIPERLFENNISVISFENTFALCARITSIPEGLFKNNVNTRDCRGTFIADGITTIPETIIEFAKKVKNKGGNTNRIFASCTSASNYNSLPSYMK